ncbi:MAG: hypothetical protein ABIQ77_06580, partial [Anaerolineales bacterium]
IGTSPCYPCPKLACIKPSAAIEADWQHKNDPPRINSSGWVIFKTEMDPDSRRETQIFLFHHISEISIYQRPN